MGIEHAKSESPIHWRYFLALEEDLRQLARYIEFAEDNFSTYSVELASLLLSAGSEIDVVAKQICKRIKRDSKANNIGHYANQIGAALPSVGKFKLSLPKYGLCLHPWKNWSSNPRKSPYWWKSYNNVKHQRHTHYKEANLKNVLNALGGLYVLVLYLYPELAEQGRLSPNPSLFRPEASFFNGISCLDTELLIKYELRS
ncbi:hypothetical protein [Deferrisoma camini]|uniref:hypothetical protein n=1 Tax=Deferrisoma camini TaxID=1035120 RepID=UPI00146CBFCD|nr:hypothetical protein [Deferrisoma camini]